MSAMNPPPESGRPDALPIPAVDWGSVYALLAALGEVTDDPSSKSFQTLALIAGMQAGDPIDEWLLRELLALAGIDIDDPTGREAVAAPLAVLHGTGLLRVVGEDDSPLRRLIEGDFDFGSRYRDLYRSRIVEQMRRVEVGIRMAQEAVERSFDDFEDEE
jgi:hypothetical protein